MIDKNEKIISGSVEESSVTWTEQLAKHKAFAVQAKWSGSAVTGLVKLQGSLNGTDFLDIPDSQENIDGSSGGFLWLNFNGTLLMVLMF